MKYILLLSVVSCMPVQAWFEHGRAADAANNGDWQRAHALLTTDLINHSDDPCVVYDVGVAAYKVGMHEQARAYFNHVTQAPRASHQLKERAYFNLGNTYVALKKLEDAIASYEQALRLDPQDERARHNLDMVKKMLEEQKQKQKEQDKQEKPDEKQQQERDKEQQKSEQQSDSEGESESERDSKQNENQQENDSKQSDAQKSDAGKQEQEQKKREQDQQRAADKQKEKKENEQQSAAADKKEQDKKEENKKDANAQRAQKLDKKLLRLLEQQEKHDADINKQMIKATVGSQMGDKHDKQCW